MFRLYSFSQANGHGEFLVISEDPMGDVRKKYEVEIGDSGSIYCDEAVSIAGDASMFPCDRPLR